VSYWIALALVLLVIALTAGAAALYLESSDLAWLAVLALLAAVGCTHGARCERIVQEGGEGRRLP